MADIDNPAEAGTAEAATPQTLDDVLDLRMKAISDRASDTAKAASGDTKTAQDGEAVDEPPAEDAKTANEDDWLLESGEEPPKDDKPETPETGQFVGRTSKVRLEDGTITTVESLIKGNMFQSDYSKKTETVSQLKKDAEERLQAAQQVEKAIATQRDLSAHLLVNMEPKAPDPALANTDPLAWIQAQATHQEQLTNWRQYVDAFIRSAQEQQQSMTKAQLAQVNDLERAELAKVAEKEPLFLDGKKSAQAIERAKEFLVKEYGYPADREFRVTDARDLRVVLDAMRYRMGMSRAKQAQEAKPKQAAPTVQKPGMRGSNDAVRSSQINQLAQRAKNSGSIEDVLALRMASKQ